MIDHGEIRRKENALEAIEKAKNNTLSLVIDIFREIPDEIVAKNQRTEEEVFVEYCVLSSSCLFG